MLLQLTHCTNYCPVSEYFGSRAEVWFYAKDIVKGRVPCKANQKGFGFWFGFQPSIMRGVEGSYVMFDINQGIVYFTNV